MQAQEAGRALVIKEIRVPRKHRGMFENNWKVYVGYGGRGSGKSHAAADACILAALQHPETILCARETQKSIKNSSHKILKNKIIKYGLLDKFRITADGIYGANGSEFIFNGIRHDPEQIKSLEGVTLTWVEEAAKVSYESWDILLPTVFRTERSRMIVTFNPRYATDATWKKFVENQQPKSIVSKSTYRDNPYTTKYMDELRTTDKNTDFEKYLHIWEGEFKKASDLQIFKNKWRTDTFEAPDDAVFYFGLDWGFSSDPLAIVRCFIKNNTLFIDYEAGGIGIEIDHTANHIDTIPESKKYIIRADNARPESISYVARQGYRIEAAPKWKGSVEDGIAHIRGFDEIVIHERCERTTNEFQLYSYKEDEGGRPLPIIVDANNHYIDAIRYALSARIKKGNDSFIAGNDIPSDVGEMFNLAGL